jgi:Flp pilus assembly pilin Flp
MLKQLWNDEVGFVISAELVLVLTIGVLAMIVGLSEVAVAVNTELNDISNAIGALNQSYSYTGFDAYGRDKHKSDYAGSSWADSVDNCDKNKSCDLVCGVDNIDSSEKGIMTF